MVTRLSFTRLLGATAHIPTVTSLCGSCLKDPHPVPTLLRRTSVIQALVHSRLDHRLTRQTGVLPWPLLARHRYLSSPQLWSHHFTAYTPAAPWRGSIQQSCGEIIPVPRRTALINGKSLLCPLDGASKFTEQTSEQALNSKHVLSTFSL